MLVQDESVGIQHECVPRGDTIESFVNDDIRAVPFAVAGNGTNLVVCLVVAECQCFCLEAPDSIFDD